MKERWLYHSIYPSIHPSIHSSTHSYVCLTSRCQEASTQPQHITKLVSPITWRTCCWVFIPFDPVWHPKLLALSSSLELFPGFEAWHTTGSPATTQASHWFPVCIPALKYQHFLMFHLDCPCKATHSPWMTSFTLVAPTVISLWMISLLMF